MAMSSTSVRLSMVLLAFVAKQGDGMRGPTQGKDPPSCEKFGAEVYWYGTCQCPKERPVPRKCEGGSDRKFDLKKTIEFGSSDCRCEEIASCEKFGAEDLSYATCQCPKERPVPRKCEGGSGRTFDLNKTIEEGSDCRCEDPCEKFGAERYQKDWCNCPDHRPLPRNCEGTYHRTFDLKKTIEEGSSDCHCEEIPSCEKFGAEDYWYNTCQCPKERPVPRKCEGGSGRTFDLKKTIEEGSNCHCEDPCEKFGAEPRGDWCICPKELPVSSRNCLGTTVAIRGRDSFRPSQATGGCRCVTEVEAAEPEEDPCAQFGAEKKERRQKSNICQCPKERPVPRKCEGKSDGSFDLLMTISLGSNCRCEEDPCAQFGAEESRWLPNTCQCPKDLPIPSRNCVGTSGRSFDLKKTIKEGSNCRCEEDPCAQFGAEKKERRQKPNICKCPKERPVPRNCEGKSDRTFNLLMTISEGSNCRCEEDPCVQFGAEERRQKPNICKCPKDLPIPSRNCEGTSGRTFDLKKTISEGSHCRCEEIKEFTCAQFGAQFGYEHNMRTLCKCPEDRPRFTKECSHSRQKYFFLRSKATEGCRCVTEVEALEQYQIPVSASALRFCDALVEQSYGKNGDGMGGGIEYALEETSPEVCQHALTGTITPQEAKEAPFAEKASELSRKGSDENRNGDRAYGRMRAVKEDATTSPTEKALWEHALAQVCKDECTDLLDMMKKEANEHLFYDVINHHVPFAQACAERVVQQVEAEVLGCCGRSCGFDGRRCLLWPFFSPQEKVEWEVECCSEISILKNSSRELMCNSVLPDRLAKEASQYDLNEQAGADIGKVLLGQNTSLFWTEKGAQESALGKEAKAHGGDKVSMDFLIKHQKIGEEYLHLGYFRKQPLTKILDEATSMMEVSSQDDTCNFGHFKEQCPQKFMTTFVKKCNEAWNVIQDSADFRHFLLHPGEGNCTESGSQNFSTPEECERLEVNSFGTVFLHYFEYKENKDLPIKCFSVAVSNEIKKQCQGKDDWWNRMEFVSVQELMNDTNGRDVNDYAQLVYIKSKKTN